MFLGADTIKPLMRRLVPDIEHVSRPRFSTLAYTGHKKVTRLPPRSAVVAFAVADVFSLAELIRRQRGGTAVVLGALSPRARNAQVGMFQAGEVDYLVATDAIGMGLNMDLDHVAFARIGKFDGRGPRRLDRRRDRPDRRPRRPSHERRHLRHHRRTGAARSRDRRGGRNASLRSADPAQLAQYPAALRFGRRPAARASTSGRSLPGLVQAREADDHRALQALARNREVAELARHRGAVRLLWEVCQIPDFRKVMSDSHARLLAHIFSHLAGPEERLPTAWIAGQMANLDRVDGDIDTLMARIAHIRTWTYITHRGDWVEGATAWQERARGIEDRLSDALHDRITQRFVDRRSAFLVRRLASDDELLASVVCGGRGSGRGRLCRPARRASASSPTRSTAVEMRMLTAAANRVLRGEVAARARLLAARCRRRLCDRRRRRAALARRTRSAASSPASGC